MLSIWRYVVVGAVVAAVVLTPSTNKIKHKECVASTKEEDWVQHTL